jgi:tetratricopeptide (TPR) repeat protein
VGRSDESLQDLIHRSQSASFVGRDGQLARFAANLALPADDPQRRFIFSVHGDAGVGKTFLVHQLLRLAAEHGAATVYLDHQVSSVPEAMARIAEQLAAQGHPMKGFVRLYDAYERRRSEVEADPRAPAGFGSTTTHTFVRAGVSAAQSVPWIGVAATALDTEALADRVDLVREYLVRKFRDPETVQMLLSPVRTLAPKFVRELATVGRRRPIALFFDTYERTGSFLEDWLHAVLDGRYGRLPGNTVISIAGRGPLDMSVWAPYLRALDDMPLAPFSDAEARRLLTGTGVTDESVVEEILAVSGRLPLLVAMLAGQRPGHPGAVGDPSGGAVEHFLKWENDPVRRALAVTAALPRTVNEDVLRVLIGGEGDLGGQFSWLRSLSFVTYQAGRCEYHSVVRSAMLRLARGQSPNRWTEQHRRLAEAYRSWRMKCRKGEVWSDGGWRSLKLEETYHLLCAEPAGALSEALVGVLRARSEGVNAVAAWVQMIASAGADTGDAAVQRWAAEMAGSIPRPGRPVIELLELILRKGGLDTAGRAEAYRQSGREYRDLRRFDEAITAFNRAVDSGVGDPMAYGGRGETFRLIGRPQEALADFNRLLAAAPADEWGLSLRGNTFLESGRLEEALADFNRVIELNPDDVWIRECRADTYRRMQQYDRVLIDQTRIVALYPDEDWAYVSRGQTYRSMGLLDEAFADFSQALELEPEDGRHYYNLSTVWHLRADEKKAAGYLAAAVRRFETELADVDVIADVEASLLLCRVLQRDYTEAARIATVLVDRLWSRFEPRETLRELGELAAMPGMDRKRISVLIDQLAPAGLAGNEPTGED